MSTVILALDDPQSPLVSLRCREYAAFNGRLGRIAGTQTELVDGAADPSAALGEVARVAVLTTAAGSGRTDEVRYVPSRQARERVGTEQDGGWPASVSSRHRKVFRRSPGAILRFPLEQRESEGEPDSLEVFITDWSPSPAACAIAVHPAHPISTGLPAGQAGAFTGRYCRHPLTGDLLPIWVAGWVKPEFGSGVVLVNPGHDKVDLDFGRQVGMPIRFGLAPADYDGSPAAWLVPPVIKTGVALRTGATDGLPYDQARTEYFKIMAERGLAEEHTDIGVGSFAVASFDEQGPASVGWDADRGTVAETAAPARLAVSRVLAAVDAATRTGELVVVAPSKSTEDEVLALRLLLAEPELGETGGKAPKLLLVGGVAGKTDDVPEPVLRLTMVVGSGIQDTLSIKPPMLEASERFLSADAELAGREPDADAENSTEIAKAATQVKSLLQKADLKQAFTQLYRLQKTVKKAPAVSKDDLATYRALAAVMTDANADSTELVSAWQAI